MSGELPRSEPRLLAGPAGDGQFASPGEPALRDCPGGPACLDAASLGPA